MIIGISGKMGTGKTTLANVLVEMLGGRRVSFADELRMEVADQFHVPMEVMTDRQCKEVCIVPVGYGYKSVRELMQWWGEMRRECNENYWVLKLLTGIKGDAPVIIDDVRYQNEADTIKKVGGTLIRLNPYEGWASGSGALHRSECDLDMYGEFDGVFWPEYGGLPHVASIIKEKLS